MCVERVGVPVPSELPPSDLGTGEALNEHWVRPQISHSYTSPSQYSHSHVGQPNKNGVCHYRAVEEGHQKDVTVDRSMSWPPGTQRFLIPSPVLGMWALLPFLLRRAPPRTQS